MPTRKLEPFWILTGKGFAYRTWVICGQTVLLHIRQRNQVVANAHSLLFYKPCLSRFGQDVARSYSYYDIAQNRACMIWPLSTRRGFRIDFWHGGTIFAAHLDISRISRLTSAALLPSDKPTDNASSRFDRYSFVIFQIRADRFMPLSFRSIKLWAHHRYLENTFDILCRQFVGLKVSCREYFSSDCHS